MEEGRAGRGAAAGGDAGGAAGGAVGAGAVGVGARGVPRKSSASVKVEKPWEDPREARVSEAGGVTRRGTDLEHRIAEALRLRLALCPRLVDARASTLTHGIVVFLRHLHNKSKCFTQHCTRAPEVRARV